MAFEESSEENEVNDFDFYKKDAAWRVAVCFDSGETKVFDWDLGSRREEIA